MSSSEKQWTDYMINSLIDNWLVKEFVDKVAKVDSPKLKLPYCPGGRIMQEDPLIVRQWAQKRLLTLAEESRERNAKLHRRSRRMSSVKILHVCQEESQSFLINMLRGERRRQTAKLVLTSNSTVNRRFDDRSIYHLFGRILPAEATARHVWHLIKQVSLYVGASLDEFSPFTYQRTSLYGNPQVKVVAKQKIPSNTLIDFLLGITVTIPEDISDESLNSILTCSRRKGMLAFLGPARFVNHDCHPNVKFERVDGWVVGFRSLRDIRPSEEILTFYGADYFGADNVDCLCRTCRTTSRSPKKYK